ncbi:putative serine/threonine-protein kinase [Aphelenchoides bicaudatus]|nr:putative serine/threonine-protein kinase [Aphelenchoides bicaudatus]
MGTPAAPVKINVGDKIKDSWVIKKKLGEGSCGTVFLVQSLKNSGPEGRAAIKVEPFMKSKDDEILKMEVFVLRKLQKFKHSCRFFMAGREKTYNFLIMSLLGKELSDLRRRYPDRKMPASASLRIGLQSIQAIQDLHSVGFVHRDVKPTNFACDAVNKNNLVIFDFGLARQIFTLDHGKMKLRDPRPKVSFRGTVRYCSINTHNYKEQGRHDDLWSCLYMLIELVTSTLPWKGMARRDSGNLKEVVSDRTLCNGCPPSFAEMSAALKKLTYFDTPPYEKFADMLKRDLAAIKTKPNDPFDWDVLKALKKKAPEEDHHEKREKDEQAEIDQNPDTDTYRDVDESAESASTDQESQTKGFAKEDTLDNVPTHEAK